MVLERLAPEAQTSDTQRLKMALQREASAAKMALRAGGPVRATRPPELRQLLRQHSRLDQRLTGFEEDMRALAILTEAEAHDLFRCDLWANRPQLFEVWILASLLHWMAQRGYDVRLLQLTPTSSGRPRWHLSYATATKPCASIACKGRTDYVFYQLRRQSQKGSRDDMPDISLLTGPSPKDNAIWAVDPKHSDRKSYRLANYEDTGSRYVKSFGADLAVIVEYYPREDLPNGNPYKLDDHALLIKDASPCGTGLPLILEQLASFHPPLQRTVLCIDMSSSFDARRTTALDAFRSTCASSQAELADDFVCFAGDARVVKGAEALLEQAATPDPPPLQSGTSLRPVLDALQLLVGSGINCIAVVGDGEFDNRSWQHTLEASLGVPVVQYS